MGEVIVESHIGEVKAELANRIPVILEALAIEAEGNAITEINKLIYDTPESPLNLQPDAITYAGVRKLRALHKKYCPTIRKGNWKHLSIKQLEKFLEEFDRFDKEIILALKKKRIKTKVADIEKDF